MLRWFRLHASRIAATATVSLIAMGGSALTPHQDDCHDVACKAIFVEHDASAHRIGAPSGDTDVHGQHCLVCHWTRSFQPRTEARIIPAPAADAGTLVHVDFIPVARRTQVAQPPLRSPPKSPVEA